MRHLYLCIAMTLSLTALGGVPIHSAHASSVRLAGELENSQVYSISLKKYRWDLPEFRMAGRNAFLIVRIENTHEHDLRVTMRCNTSKGTIPKMSGTHALRAGEYMYVDTRRLRDPMQKGKGVRVKCRFRANGTAKVEAWIYDEDLRVARLRAAS